MEKYDIILIQPPLFQNLNYASNEVLDASTQIELSYWKTMEQNNGRLLGDLPVEASYGILSIASYLEKAGYKVKLLDFHFDDFYMRKCGKGNITQNHIKECLSKYKANFYGITVMTIAEDWANKITNTIRELSSDSIIFWGGYYPTHNDQNILKHNRNIDFIMRNEGEYTAKEILDFQKSSIEFDISKVKGITYLREETVCRTEDRSIIHDLDNLPFLNYSLYKQEYLDLIVPRIYTARGCKNGCHYCTADNAAMKQTRKRNPKTVVDEIEYVMEKYNKNFFVMGDLEFLLDSEHSKEICKEIIRRNLDVKWWCQVYPPHLEENVVKLMKQAGNIQIALGIESTNSDALEEINKTMDSNITINSCRLIKKYGIQIQAYIMIGLPGETCESVMHTIDFVGKLIEKNLIDVTHISTMVAYPGTILYNESEKFNIQLVSHDTNKYFMNCDFLGSGIPAYSTKHLTNMEIYCLWLYALAHCQKKFEKCHYYEDNYRSLYDDLGITKLSILDNFTLTV